MPATSAALITYKDQLLTSITADVVGRRTVLFLGTADGKVKKVRRFSYHDISTFLLFAASPESL